MHLHKPYANDANKKKNNNDLNNDNKKESEGTFPHMLKTCFCGKLCGKLL